MITKYHKVNFKKDIILPKNIKEINRYIYDICSNLPAFEILNDNKLLKKTIVETKKFAKSKKNFIVFGTGGSNLGARAITNILNKQSNNKIDFFDNIDPIFFEKNIKKIDIRSTGFIVISKSGVTPETLAQFGSIIELAAKSKLLPKLFANSLIITEFKDSPLFNIAKKNNCLLFEHNKDIGGRYSIFSNVGLVPSIIAGMDVKLFHKGARNILKTMEQNSYKLGQIFRYQNNLNFRSNVIMTYSDSLYYFGKWYLQLWAESIGKKNRGITAIHSIGTTDQHSQLQLYLDGPKDKFFTIITTNHLNKGLKINSKILNNQNINYLSGKRMGDLMQAEQKATLDTLKLNNIKYREIFIEKINEESLGILVAKSIIETIAACIYFKVNPFNQPAVEQSKVLVKKYLTQL